MYQETDEESYKGWLVYALTPNATTEEVSQMTEIHFFGDKQHYYLCQKYEIL